MDVDRARELKGFERDAEALVAHQLDLIAQLERQLRAVHRTMRQIEKLRTANRRVGPELSNGEKSETLNHLTDELSAIDDELNTQHESCAEMKATIDHMRARLSAIRRPSATAPDMGAPDSGQSPL
jgi:chaperonin cofactor prefoldin